MVLVSGGRKTREFLFSGYRVSAGKDKIIVEMDGGDGYTPV